MKSHSSWMQAVLALVCLSGVAGFAAAQGQ